jgi:drug/metabolite transporter (DMT)-like permease
MKPSLRGAFYGLGAAAIWGGMYVVSDVVLDTIPPFTLLSMRLVMAVAILGGLLLSRQRSFKLAPRDWLTLLAVGFVGFGVSVGAQFVGTDRSTAVNGALITSASPAFILVFAALILRERLTAIRIFAVVLASIGVVVIIDPANADFSSVTFTGDVALAAAALTWGLYSVLVRLVSAKHDTLLVSTVALMGGLLLTLPASAIELQSRPIGAVDLGTIMGILYLGIVSTAAAMWMWNRAFALVDASVASLFFFAQPLVGTVLGVVILGQAMTAGLWIGSALIILGVLVSMVKASEEKPADTTSLSQKLKAMGNE